ncbi:unnamed protein product [Nezara viridula]|uniref:Uncharacterized protein n=1 Tax=Nezara viridula TaxID=85310 RepID=A0A9P0E6C3_NEZVI|nr:unnamed protein product [Nezara viridula]
MVKCYCTPRELSWRYPFLWEERSASSVNISRRRTARYHRGIRGSWVNRKSKSKIESSQMAPDLGVRLRIKTCTSRSTTKTSRDEVDGHWNRYLMKAKRVRANH